MEACKRSGISKGTGYYFIRTRHWPMNPPLTPTMRTRLAHAILTLRLDDESVCGLYSYAPCIVQQVRKELEG